MGKIGSYGEFEGVPYFAVGNDELKDKPQVGDNARCPNCKKSHVIEFGKNVKTGKTDKILGFVSCPKGGDFLVAVAGKLL